MDSETEVCATDAEILKISYFKHGTKSLFQKRKNVKSWEKVFVSASNPSKRII